MDNNSIKSCVWNSMPVDNPQKGIKMPSDYASIIVLNDSNKVRVEII